ncbi:hypothetical protein [Dyella sp. C11]|nr:hypothetical protein [Dyella sp. C11]
MDIDDRHIQQSWWRRSGWFVFLWLSGVIVTLAISTVFKFLILGVVRHV